MSIIKKTLQQIKYKLTTENLAVPEVHTGKIDQPDTCEEPCEETISYENLAVPEIHIRKK